MKRFLLKLVSWAAVFSVIVILSEEAGADPALYLLGLWLWKDLSETSRKEEEVPDDRI